MRELMANNPPDTQPYSPWILAELGLDPGANECVATSIGHDATAHMKRMNAIPIAGC
jgi:hypothetical protein